MIPRSPLMESETISCAFTQTFPTCWFGTPLSNEHVVTFFCVLASPEGEIELDKGPKEKARRMYTHTA